MFILVILRERVFVKSVLEHSIKNLNDNFLPKVHQFLGSQ